MYRSGVLKLEVIDKKPLVGELGLTDNNFMFYEDGKIKRLVNDPKVKTATILPSVVDPETNQVLVVPGQFTVQQLYAIMNKKIQEGDYVRFICYGSGRPRLSTLGKVTLVPMPKLDRREDLLDMLEVFGNHVRVNPGDIDVEAWLLGYQEHLGDVERNAQRYSHDTDEDTPRLTKRKHKLVLQG